MENREGFYFDDSDNLESDDTIEKEEHSVWVQCVSGWDCYSGTHPKRVLAANDEGRIFGCDIWLSLWTTGACMRQQHFTDTKWIEWKAQSTFLLFIYQGLQHMLPCENVWAVWPEYPQGSCNHFKEDSQKTDSGFAV